MSEEVSIDAVMARRFQLVEDMAILSGKHAAELKPMGDELKLCELYIKDSMLKGGLQQIKTDAGMTYFTPKTSVTVEDMDQVIHFILAAAPPYSPPAGDGAPDYRTAENKLADWQNVLEHIRLTGMWGLLNKAVNKTAAVEITEANKAPVPGTKFDTYRDLAWRRGKS